MSEPQILESTINFSGGGKVAIKDYGKISSEYHGSLTRKWAVPGDWNVDRLTLFEIEQIEALRAQLDPVLQAEFDERYSRREWEGERGPLAGE